MKRRLDTVITVTPEFHTPGANRDLPPEWHLPDRRSFKVECFHLLHPRGALAIVFPDMEENGFPNRWDVILASFVKEMSILRQPR